MAAKLRGMLDALDLGPLGKTQRSNGCTDGKCWESGTEINDSLSKAFWYIKHVLLHNNQEASQLVLRWRNRP
eukprot:6775907-Karenia_brevis.AAC.1